MWVYTVAQLHSKPWPARHLDTALLVWWPLTVSSHSSNNDTWLWLSRRRKVLFRRPLDYDTTSCRIPHHQARYACWPGNITYREMSRHAVYRLVYLKFMLQRYLVASLTGRIHESLGNKNTKAENSRSCRGKWMTFSFDIAQCSLVEAVQCFEGAYCLHDQNDERPSPWWWRRHATLKCRSTFTRLRRATSQDTVTSPQRMLHELNYLNTLVIWLRAKLKRTMLWRKWKDATENCFVCKPH